VEHRCDVPACGRESLAPVGLSLTLLARCHQHNNYASAVAWRRSPREQNFDGVALAEVPLSQQRFRLGLT